MFDTYQHTTLTQSIIYTGRVKVFKFLISYLKIKITYLHYN